MRLCTFERNGGPTPGLVVGDTVHAIVDAVPGAPADMIGILSEGPDLWARISAAARGPFSTGTPIASAIFFAPIPRPRRNVFCVGWNYSMHFAEGQLIRGASAPADLPEFPALFSKNPATVTGHGSPVRDPAPHSVQLDWEVELAVVIGRGGRDISEGSALEHVFGYTVANDVSVRDVQRRHGGQWFKGKNFDTHLPMGPWIVTADEIGDPHHLHLTSRINGVTKQDSSTDHMVFRIPRLIREFSSGTALEPGDLMITGTPEGVGFARKPPEYLKRGDVMEMEIEKIGILRNVIA